MPQMGEKHHQTSLHHALFAERDSIDLLEPNTAHRSVPFGQDFSVSPFGILYNICTFNPYKAHLGMISRDLSGNGDSYCRSSVDNFNPSCSVVVSVASTFPSLPLRRAARCRAVAAPAPAS